MPAAPDHAHHSEGAQRQPQQPGAQAAPGRRKPPASRPPHRRSRRTTTTRSRTSPAKACSAAAELTRYVTPPFPRTRGRGDGTLSGRAGAACFARAASRERWPLSTARNCSQSTFRVAREQRPVRSHCERPLSRHGRATDPEHEGDLANMTPARTARSATTAGRRGNHRHQHRTHRGDVADLHDALSPPRLRAEAPHRPRRRPRRRAAPDGRDRPGRRHPAVPRPLAGGAGAMATRVATRTGIAPALTRSCNAGTRSRRCATCRRGRVSGVKGAGSVSAAGSVVHCLPPPLGRSHASGGLSSSVRWPTGIPRRRAPHGGLLGLGADPAVVLVRPLTGHQLLHTSVPPRPPCSASCPKSTCPTWRS